MVSKGTYSLRNVIVNFMTHRHESAILILIGLIACSIMLSCATGSKEGETTAEDPKMQKEVYFLDSASFDNKLYKMLANAPSSVKVKFPQTVMLNEIPERLDRWFYKVEKFDGEVKLEVDPNVSSKGIITEIYSIVIGMYTIIKEKALYDPVKHYNATVYYIPGSGEISRVVFFHK